MARDVSNRGPMLLPAFKLAASNFPRSIFKLKKDTVYSQGCPRRSRKPNEFKKDWCSRNQHSGCDSCVHSVKMKTNLEKKNKKKMKKTGSIGFRRSVKPLNQSIADIELNDASVGASVGIKPQIVGVAVTKNDVNGMVLDPLPVNDNKLDHLASGVACQERREECPVGKTGTTIMCC